MKLIFKLIIKLLNELFHDALAICQCVISVGCFLLVFPRIIAFLTTRGCEGLQTDILQDITDHMRGIREIIRKFIANCDDFLEPYYPWSDEDILRGVEFLYRWVLHISSNSYDGACSFFTLDAVMHGIFGVFLYRVLPFVITEYYKYRLKKIPDFGISLICVSEYLGVLCIMWFFVVSIAKGSNATSYYCTVSRLPLQSFDIFDIWTFSSRRILKDIGVLLFLMFPALFLFFIVTLFYVGVIGLIFNRFSYIHVLVCFEILSLAVTLNFFYIGLIYQLPVGFVFGLLTMGLAAVETTVGLSILVGFYRRYGHVNINNKS